MLGQRIERESVKGFAVECPLEHRHTTGKRFDTSTMIADPSKGTKGYFLCEHRCGDMTAEKVLKLLPADAVDRARKRHEEAQRSKRSAPANVTARCDDTGATADRTDLRNAEYFIEWFGEDVRFVRTWSMWLGYDGVRWRVDDYTGAHHRAKETVRRLLSIALDAQRAARDAVKEAEATGDQDATRKAKSQLAIADSEVAHTVQSQSASRIAAIPTLAQSDPRIAIDHTCLDADHSLLNVPNGTIDLRTGKLREHRREDLITRVAPVAFDPDAQCPIWDKFVLDAMGGDRELVAFLDRFAGYCLTGNTREEVLVFFHGAGGNGKGTWTRTMLLMLGDYAAPAPRKLLFRSNAERHDTELAYLHKLRLAVCSEIDDGQVFDEALAKDLTGSDPITARRMRENNWSFVPTHKLLLHGQYKPTVRGDDDGAWRRMCLVPWAVSFTAIKDETLKDRLVAELPGILARTVRGCLAWHKMGLGPPEAVRRATADYRRENDRLGDFARRFVVFERGVSSPASAIRVAYTSHCEDTGDAPFGARRFWERLRLMAHAAGADLEATSVRVPQFGGGTRPVDGYRNIRLRTEEEREKGCDEKRTN